MEKKKLDLQTYFDLTTQKNSGYLYVYPPEIKDSSDLRALYRQLYKGQMSKDTARILLQIYNNKLYENELKLQMLKEYMNML